MKKNSEDLNNLSNLFFVTHEALQRQTARSIDLALVIRNWLFGWYIVEFEQKGDAKSKYGSGFLTTLSKQLQTLKIKGSSTTRLKLYRSFYLSYSQISPTLSAPSFGLPSIGPTLSDDFINHELREGIKELTTFFQLGWSHYVSLLTIKSETERKFYEIEAHANNWSVRELKRQIESSLYERLALSRNKHQVKELAEKAAKNGFSKRPPEKPLYP